MGKRIKERISGSGRIVRGLCQQDLWGGRWTEKPLLHNVEEN